MLYIEHLNLVVKDINVTLAFYQAAFPHWKIRAKGQQNWYGKERSWLHFGDDFQFLTFNDGGVNENRDVTSHQIGLSHFAFVTTNLEQLIYRLKESGFNIAKNGENSTYRKNVYFIDPDGFDVEFVEYLSDVPKERNLVH